jgi:hypothetical protein
VAKVFITAITGGVTTTASADFMNENMMEVTQMKKRKSLAKLKVHMSQGYANKARFHQMYKRGGTQQELLEFYVDSLANGSAHDVIWEDDNEAFERGHD